MTNTKEYIIRRYCLANEPMLIAVYVRAVDGSKFIQEFHNSKQARAFTAALDGLGFTRKLR